MSHVSDEEFHRIVEGCLRQDRGQQNQLYRLYYSYGMSVGIRYVKSEQEAIEVLNQSFLKVFSNLRKYNRTKPFKPWLRTIIVNTAINALKAKERFRYETGLDGHENEVKDGQDILSDMNYQELIATIQTLPLAYRTVFNMYVIDGYKHHEIAEKLGISVGTSKSNLTRARAKLRTLISQKSKDVYEN